MLKTNNAIHVQGMSLAVRDMHSIKWPHHSTTMYSIAVARQLALLYLYYTSVICIPYMATLYFTNHLYIYISIPCLCTLSASQYNGKQ